MADMDYGIDFRDDRIAAGGTAGRSAAEVLPFVSAADGHRAGVALACAIVTVMMKMKGAPSSSDESLNPVHSKGR